MVIDQRDQSEASGHGFEGRDIAMLVETGAADPKAVIASLFTRAGVRFTPGPDGVPRLQ